MKAKVIVLLTVLAVATRCNSSAIPMWEFLSRDEKVSGNEADAAPPTPGSFFVSKCCWKFLPS